MTPANVWVVIPAHRQALGHLQENLKLLGPELASRTVVVTNGQHPITEHEVDVAQVIQAGMDINISRWWNLGLDWIEEQEDGHPHHVLILNADARIKPEGVARLSYALDTNPGYVMAGPKAGVGIERETRPGPLGVHVRVPGWCFMLNMQAIDSDTGGPFRIDERFLYWCGDDDVEWRARAAGGTLRVGRIECAHLGDGVPRGDLARLAREDLARFEEKWRTRPW